MERRQVGVEHLLRDIPLTPGHAPSRGEGILFATRYSLFAVYCNRNVTTASVTEATARLPCLAG